MNEDFSPEQQEIIDSLFDDALQGRIPRQRALKPQEVERLNERHLAMILMRAAGYHQRVIAKAFGASDTNVHFVLNHPDAEYLLARLMSMKAAQPTDITRRLQALSEPAVSALEDVFLEDDADSIKVAMKKAPLAFKVLELNGHSAPKKVEGKVEHRHTLEAGPREMAALTRALREARQIQDAEIIQGAEAREVMSELSPYGGGDGVVGAAGPGCAPAGPSSPSEGAAEPGGASPGRGSDPATANLPPSEEPAGPEGDL